MANTSAKNATNKANNDKTQMEGKAENLPDFSTWTKHQIGFAPYWRPTEGNDWTYMELVAKDTRDPMFTRYLCTALKTTECRRGPANDDENANDGRVGEKVIVEKGDTFSISVYYSLVDEFNFFIFARNEHNIKVPCKLTAGTKTKTRNLKEDGTPREVRNWELLSDPAKRPGLERHRDAWRTLVASERKNEETEREQVQE